MPGVKGMTWKTGKRYTKQWIDRKAVALVKYTKEPGILFLEEFCERHRFATQRISELCDKSEIFSEAVKRFKDVQRKRIVIAAMANKINCAVAIFTLKNVSGWKDSPLIDQSKHVHTTFNLEGKDDGSIISAINNRLAARISK
jgi:hypothetical protein